jgi:cellulose synthase/poly-beta-1,6-N-acetylglucosamine synthase-like glycosyltransferase
MRTVRGLLLVPEALLVGIGGYIGLVTGAAWWARRKGASTTAVADPSRHRFVVMIPAHDEERLIGSALDSLAALDYPRDMVRVHVVADNCTDGTASVVRAHGAEVHERVAPDDGGKGPSLQWLLWRLRDRDEPFDAVVIIDADTTVSPNLLRVMDAKLAGGAAVAQAYYCVRDPETSSVAAFRAAALAVRHYLRPLGRTQLGGSAPLHGNGMAFRAEVLAGHTWSNHLTEDIELQLELLLQGTPVAFAPDAMVRAEMPTTIEGSRTQHERWERGRIEMTQRYVPALLRRAVTAPRGDRLACVDAAVDQLLPPFSVIVAATAVWSGVALVAAVVAPGRRRLAVAAGLLVTQAACVVSALRMVGAPPAVYRALLGAPRLVAWKVRLWLRMVCGRRDVQWVRTARNAERGSPPGDVATCR